MTTIQEEDMKVTLTALLCALLLTTACTRIDPADLVLRGGKIATVDEAFSIHEAVAVRGDRIIFVGRNTGAIDYIGPDTQILELEGNLVLPGLIDSHAHLHSLGDELTYLNITGTTSFAQIVETVAERVETVQPGE